jgi:hypothetical protein
MIPMWTGQDERLWIMVTAFATRMVSGASPCWGSEKQGERNLIPMIQRSIITIIFQESCSV